MFYVPNLQMAWSHGTTYRASMGAFERDIEAGMPSPRIAQQQYGASFFLIPSDLIASRVRQLRLRDINQFRQEHLTAVVPLRIEPSPLQDVVRHDRAGGATDHDPYVVYRFRKPHYAWGIRLTCSYEGQMDSPAALQAFWKLRGRNEFTDRERMASFTIRGNEEQVFLLIDDVIDSLRIDPDTWPRRFRISRMELIREPDPSVAVLGSKSALR
jgi:hypothetical protein